MLPCQLMKNRTHLPSTFHGLREKQGSDPTLPDREVNTLYDGETMRGKC